jgi:hypothetical protein
MTSEYLQIYVNICNSGAEIFGKYSLHLRCVVDGSSRCARRYDAYERLAEVPKVEVYSTAAGTRRRV